MRTFALLFLFIGLTKAANLPMLPTASSLEDSDSPSGGEETPGTSYIPTTSTYGDGTTTTRCTPYDEIKYVDKCYDYTDRVCYTTYSEKCKNVVGQTCHGHVSTSQRRPCFDVHEKVCSLREEVKYEVIDVVITVQKCSKVPERVCNKYYVIDWTDSHHNQCINLTNMVCSTQERTVFEKTCHYNTKYDCESGYGSGYVQAKSDYGSSQYQVGSVTTLQASPDYDYSAEATCEKRVETKCTTNPRKLSTQSCSERQDEVCEMCSYRTPFPVEKEKCHYEDKKVCTIVQTTQPKQIKKYNYTEVCRPIRKRICENTDVKKLVPSCTPSTRPECHIAPSETCEDIPKRYCAKVPVTVRHEKCETVTTSINTYGGTDTVGYDDTEAASDEAVEDPMINFE